MTTPLGLARKLRLAFPEFVEVKMVREAPYKLRAYCALPPSTEPVPHDRLDPWIRDHRMAGTVLAIDQVEVLPALDDEEGLLRRTNVSRVLAEQANTTGPGLMRHLEDLFPGVVHDISDVSGHVAIHVDASWPTVRDQEILDVTRLLMICDVPSLQVSRQQINRQQPASGRQLQHTQAESSATYRHLQEDIARLHEQVPHVLVEESIALPQLPDGSSTYGSVHDGVESLLHRLALFERVYMYMPFAVDDFPAWVGASLDEFLDVLPTGRVVPVFGQSLDRYEGGLTTRVLEAAAPHVVLRGELVLRSMRSFCSDHPALGIVDSEPGAELRRTLAAQSDERAALFATYLDALADVASRLPSTAVSGRSLGEALFPIAQWIDAIRATLGLPERSLEITGAVEHRAATEAVGGAPMVLGGHYLDGALRFVYGAEPGGNEVMRIPDPEVIGRICFPDTKGLTPKEFATTFSGPRVEAMRALMASTRVQTADGSVDLVKAFNDELQTYGRRTETGYTAVATILGVVGVFALSAPTAIAGLGLDLARRVLGRKAPVALATLTSKMTGTTREAALLARIQKK